MSLNNLIGQDIKLMRDRYDEALKLRGIPAKYQFPNLPTTNTQGESVVDTYSIEEDVHIFFDGNPKVKTYKRLGWVVENADDLPFLIHCSFNLQHLQKDCLFRIAGQYTELPDRVFRVTELTYDIQAPDHIICQVVPVFNNSHGHIAGRTDKEIERTFNKSNHFLKQNKDYEGRYISEQKGEQ